MIRCKKVVSEILSSALERPILVDFPAASMTLTMLHFMSIPQVVPPFEGGLTRVLPSLSAGDRKKISLV
jgi:hypothetical protein